MALEYKSRSNANRLLPREHDGHSKHHPPPTTQEMTMCGQCVKIVNPRIRLIIFFEAEDEETKVEWFYEDL